MLLGLSDALPTLVEGKFKDAKAAQALVFSPTELAIIRTTSGIPFQLRYCPALAKKPTPQKEADNGPKPKKPDPFDNPPSELLVAEVPASSPSHIVVLNKFPVIVGHFILATKTNKQQTHVLEQDDLEMTYACLRAWENGQAKVRRRRLFAFFNSGEHSGASQPHRHLQFLPVESMRDRPDSEGWELLIDLLGATPKRSEENSSIRGHPDVPFTHFACDLPPEPTAAQLLETYHDLYKAAKSSVEDFAHANPGALELHPTEDGSLPISYNLAITTSTMAICPRRKEGDVLRGEAGSEIGFVALNGTTLGGTLMVKREEEWNALREQPEQLDRVLSAIGIPHRSGKSAL